MRAALISLRLRLAWRTPEQFDEFEFLWDEAEAPEDDSEPETQTRGQAA
ncbi:MAG: hypothetical protein M9913_09450 [Bryobacteraceae bacterium]|nr:hypothetical protein [Solibacteraceae bacterium]MCO5351109.1 hypothetical protein [Bryobacteraceae bacterium]